MEKSEFLVIRLSDFGTENVDWFWNASTTEVTNTTTYSGTSRAAITWTPSEVEDWVALGYVYTDILSTTVNAEARITLDGTLHSGDWSAEGEAGTEKWPFTWWDVLPSPECRITQPVHADCVTTERVRIIIDSRHYLFSARPSGQTSILMYPAL